MEGLFFYLFAGAAVLSALLMITRRDAVTSAFWLIFCFLSIAGLFAMLSAHFLAILQILLYAGAVMVFFLFVTMFLGKEARTLRPGNRLVFLLGLASIAALGSMLARVAESANRPFPPVAASYGGIERVSELLLTRYVFGFELVGVLLTAAVIGAVHLARREAAGARAAREIHLRSDELQRERAARLAEASEHAAAQESHAAEAGGHHA